MEFLVSFNFYSEPKGSQNVITFFLGLCSRGKRLICLTHDKCSVLKNTAAQYKNNQPAAINVYVAPGTSFTCITNPIYMIPFRSINMSQYLY